MRAINGCWYYEIVANEPQGISPSIYRIRSCCLLPLAHSITDLTLSRTHFDLFDQPTAKRTTHPSGHEKLQSATERVPTSWRAEVSHMVMYKAMVTEKYLRWE